jgi:fatty-acyl-CoA synthase
MSLALARTAAEPLLSTSLLNAGTIPILIEKLAMDLADRPAVTDEGGTLTYRALRTRVLALAGAMYSDGVRHGDSVGVLMGNRSEWIVGCLAAQYLGAIVVAVNTWYTVHELAYVLAHADVRVLIAQQSFLRSNFVDMVASLRPWNETLPSLRRVVILDADPGEGMTSWDDYLASAEEANAALVDAAWRAVSPQDVALLLYTSGSTASPKGVRLAHWGLIRNCFDIGERQHLSERDTLLLPISLFWGFGCSNGLMAALTHATHIVLQDHFNAESSVALIERHRCTALYATANMMQAILDLPDIEGRDISCLRTGLTFGSAAMVREVQARLAPEICQVYGLTEGYGNSVVTDIYDPLDKRLNTCGRVLPGSELRIVDPLSGELLPNGREGEIRIRGCIMPGYHKDPATTAKAFDADGFFLTGDIGMLDQDGFLVFRGRLKEIVKTGGMNVSPAEVEDILRKHPAVSEAFVTGLADPVREEIVVAVIVPVEGTSFSDEEIAVHCRSYLSAFKVPRRFKAVSVADLPLTTTRKVHRARLHELFA